MLTFGNVFDQTEALEGRAEEETGRHEEDRLELQTGQGHI